MVEPERTQKIWRLRVAHWISKQEQARARAPTPTNPHAHAQKYVILVAFLHAKSGFVHAPQCYVIRILRVLFTLSFYVYLRHC